MSATQNYMSKLHHKEVDGNTMVDTLLVDAIIAEDTDKMKFIVRAAMEVIPVVHKDLFCTMLQMEFGLVRTMEMLG